jgi:hypothetical protein
LEKNLQQSKKNLLKKVEKFWFKSQYQLKGQQQKELFKKQFFLQRQKFVFELI